MLKALPSGIDDFKELIEKDYYFIDKTMLIDEILNNKAKITLYTRPRRFGKTLNMSMIKYFFDMNNKEQNKKLFSNLKIENTKHIEKQGKYPVISISFKNIEAKSISQFKGLFYELISNLLKEYKDIRGKLDEVSKIKFDSLYYKKDDAIFETSLYFITQILKEYYNKNIIVLIDEYDAPIINALNTKNEEYIEYVLDFMKSLLGNALKGNENLEFGILTGILRITGQGLFSGFNNIEHKGIISLNTNEFYGFTEKEVKEALHYYNLQYTFDNVKSWYDGYNFSGKEIYNPWSIIKYLANKDLKSYWTQSSTNEIIIKLMSMLSFEKKKQFQKLIEKEAINIQYDETYEIGLLSNPNTLWELLLYTGYLTIEKYNNDDIEVRIVNYEVLSALKNMYAKSIEQDGTNRLLNAIIDEDKENLKQILNEKIYTSTSYNDLTQENSLHNLVLGILIATNTNYEITSNKENGKGRYDILIRNKLTNKVYVIELKKSKNIEEVFKQMKENKYAIGYDDVTYITIVHKGKEIEVDIRK